jgi:parvulin-like peptidyl-prolyl isomerase
MRLDPGSAWQGPVQSDHGWHLVLLRRRELAQVPPLADVVVRVREDALAAKRQGALDEAVGKLLERYEVRTR